MHLYESCWIHVVGLTRHFNLWTILHFSLWCHFTCVFLSSCILLQDSKGHTLFSPPCVRTSMHRTWPSAGSHTFYQLKLSYLSLCTTVVKELHYHPLLRLLLQTVWGLVMNSYRGDPLNVGRSNTIKNTILYSPSSLRFIWKIMKKNRYFNH